MKNKTAVTKTTKTAKATTKKVTKPAEKKAAPVVKDSLGEIVPESAQVTEGAPGAGGGAAKPATKKAAKTAKPKAEKKPKADKPMKVRLYGKGEFYFGSKAAARINGAPYIALEAKGKTVTLTPTKSGKDAHALMFCHKAPVLRVKEALKDLGFVTFATQDLDVKLVGENAFQVEVR